MILYDLHDLDNHDGVITHLGPDILKCEVKWALESITTNKASGCDGIPVELFQILHRTGKGQFSFQYLRTAIPKNAETTTQLHSSHMLVR